MSDWRSVWRMVRFCWKRDWTGALFTFLFALYIGWLTGFSIEDVLSAGGGSKITQTTVDLMYLMMFPTFGLMMNRNSFGISREDTYTKKIAHWRTMPIPLKTIVKARLVNAILLAPVLGSVCLLLQFVISAAVRERFSLLDWLMAGWIWIGYALAVNAVLVWLELGVSGKVYMRLYWVFIGVCALVSTLLKMGDVTLVGQTIGQIESGHYYWMPISLLLGAAALFAGYRMTVARMRKRAYVF